MADMTHKTYGADGTRWQTDIIVQRLAQEHGLRDLLTLVILSTVESSDPGSRIAPIVAEDRLGQANVFGRETSN